MSRYTAISLPEIKEVLREEKGWRINNLAKGNEFVFEFPLSTRPHIIIRVCSSIKRNNEDCRECGEDAIRVYAFNSIQNKGWIATKRVYRVEGWRNNLTNTVTAIFKQATERKF